MYSPSRCVPGATGPLGPLGAAGEVPGGSLVVRAVGVHECLCGAAPFGATPSANFCVRGLVP